MSSEISVASRVSPGGVPGCENSSSLDMSPLVAMIAVCARGRADGGWVRVSAQVGSLSQPSKSAGSQSSNNESANGRWRRYGGSSAIVY